MDKQLLITSLFFALADPFPPILSSPPLPRKYYCATKGILPSAPSGWGREQYSCCTHISSLESRIPSKCAWRCKQLQHLGSRWPCKKVLSAHWKILKMNKHSLGSFVPIIYLLLRTLTLFLLAVLPWYLYSTSCLLTSKNRFKVLAKLRVFSHPLSKDYIGCEDDEQNVFFPNILLW